MIVIVAVWIVRSTLRAQRERVWSTMARESAHQLSTPLSSLSGWVEILQIAATDRSKVASDDVIAREIAVDVERLEKVAQRFELIGRPPRRAPVDVGRILKHLQRYFVARLPRLDRSIQFDVSVANDLPRVDGNSVLLEWAFENILKNSIDVLAGRGGRIAVQAEPTDGRVRIHFYDDGPGIPTELRGRIFEPGVSSKQGGWGVGLSLARRIIEGTHQGSITLGRPEQGAEFIVELPAVESEQAG